ncbi:acyl-CoA dehydrogenase, partial [Rhodococcus hoagii]|nr:acyl-CoA dehydrogenase [Prescottella equi]
PGGTARASPRPGELWGVWAAEPPAPALTARATDGGYVLDGRKLWCSGAHSCTHALVTARTDSGRALFAVDLRGPGSAAVPDTWHAVGMGASDSGAVDFVGTPAVRIGEPGAYLDRPGFWHGAIGVAACWYGGAVAVADELRRRVGDDPFRLAHLGAVDAALYAAHCVLDVAAEELDRDPTDGRAAHVRARRVRAVIEAAATETVDRVGRALGAGPLCSDRSHAQLVADLTVYLRQSHAEHDLADLGSALSRPERTIP